MSKDNLGDRMKNYETVPKNFLLKKTPVIIRLDGRSFHQFCKGLNKPFDGLLSDCMAKTTEYLLNNISGCVFGYTQSDEISLLLIDTQDIDTQPFFDNNQQKLVSISSSIATLAFNKFFMEMVDALDPSDYKNVLTKKKMSAIFDSRAFNIPDEDVINYFIWRQNDATKNSITMLAQAHFSHKELQGKSGSNKQDMLMTKNINWNNLDIRYKRGLAVFKKNHNIITDTGSVIRRKSYIDLEMPILSKDKDFIKEILRCKNE